MTRSFVAMLGASAALLGGCGGAVASVPDSTQEPTDTGGSSNPPKGEPTDTSGDPPSDKPGPTGASAPSGPTTAATKALGESCTQDAECKSAACFVGGAASYCSLRCTIATANTICVAPFSGACNMRGYCKK
jgi:hypothetical protein